MRRNTYQITNKMFKAEFIRSNIMIIRISSVGMMSNVAVASRASLTTIPTLILSLTILLKSYL